MSYNYFFKVFSNALRIRIIELLRVKSRSVSEICSELNEEQSKVSHNLYLLMRCHVVTVQKKGKNRIYSLNKSTIKPLLDLVEKHVSSYCSSDCWKNKRGV